MSQNTPSIVLGQRSDNYLAKAILLEEAVSPRFLRMTILFATALVVAFIAWAATSKLDVVASAQGRIAPTGSVQIVQHLDGGRIAAINVVEGQRVRKGEVLIALNPIEAKAELDGFIARADKLQAEVRYLREVANIRGGLAQERLITRTQALEAQRTLAAVEGEYDRALFEIERLRERLSRVEILSPVDGIVQDLLYKTVGGVITPGATVLNVVPIEDIPRAEVRVLTSDVGFVKEGQPVRIKVATYDYLRYGILDGRVSLVSAFSSIDEQGVPYFLTYVELSRESIGVAGREMPILPGMTVQADIVTDEQTVLQYLLRPLFVALSQGMRER